MTGTMERLIRNDVGLVLGYRLFCWDVQVIGWVYGFQGFVNTLFVI